MVEKPETPQKATYANDVEVPAEYTKLYSLLDTQLDDFEQINRSYPSINSGSVFGAHLLVADANRGPMLFHFTTMIGVELTLYRFKRMGVQGITLVIGYPLLVPGFEDNQKYLTFYSKVARAVRKHGMKLLVELNVLFVNSEFSPFEHDFGSLSFERFIVENRTMAQLVIDRLQPDFLTILHEPQTFSVLAGFDEFYKPYKAFEYVKDILNGLKRHNTMVGAGAGNWDDLSYFKKIAASEVDYVSLHIYPIDKAFIHRAYEASGIAAEANKPLVITEGWLYKSDGKDTAAQANLEGWMAGFRRDAFSFWELLDKRFLDNFISFVQSTNTIYSSPFWTIYMFAYVDYNQKTSSFSYKKLVRRIAPPKVAGATIFGRLTGTGHHYKSLIRKPKMKTL